MPQWFQTTQIARPVYYDRPGVVTLQQVNTNFADGFGATAMTSYTVPTGKKAFLDSFFATVERTAAAGAVAFGRCRMQVQPISGGNGFLGGCALYSGAIGASVFSAIPTIGYLTAGDNVQIIIENGSAGGACNYNGAVKLTEFQA